MLRDNLVGLIEPMFRSAGADPLALCNALRESSDDRPPCLENPRPEGAESTLTENASSPFHAEPKHPRQEEKAIIRGLLISGVRLLNCLPRYDYKTDSETEERQVVQRFCEMFTASHGG